MENGTTTRLKAKLYCELEMSTFYNTCLLEETSEY